MFAGRHVWTGQDLTVNIYRDDGAGNRLNAAGSPFVEGVDSPLLTYCYFQNVTVRAAVPTRRIPITGRKHRKILRDAYEYDANVSYFYFQKSKEWNVDQIFNREKPLQIDMFLYDPVSQNDSDHHILKVAYAEEVSFNGRENDILEGSAKFIAEQFA